MIINSSQPTALTLDSLLHAIELMSKPRGRFLVRHSPFAYEAVPIKRTWRERLFTWPWRPRQKFRIERKPLICTVDIPDSPICKMEISGRIIVAHPLFKDRIDEILAEEGK